MVATVGMNLTKFQQNDNRAGDDIYPQYIPASIPEAQENTSGICASGASESAPPFNIAIAQERVRFELEFAFEPDFDAIERSLQILKKQHDADEAVARRVIDLMAEEGAA